MTWGKMTETKLLGSPAALLPLWMPSALCHLLVRISLPCCVVPPSFRSSSTRLTCSLSFGRESSPSALLSKWPGVCMGVCAFPRPCQVEFRPVHLQCHTATAWRCRCDPCSLHVRDLHQRSQDPWGSSLSGSVGDVPCVWKPVFAALYSSWLPHLCTCSTVLSQQLSMVTAWAYA